MCRLQVVTLSLMNIMLRIMQDLKPTTNNMKLTSTNVCFLLFVLSKFSNAKQDDLWTSLTAFAVQDGSLVGGMTLKQVK